jgi:hypothetical protein
MNSKLDFCLLNKTLKSMLLYESRKVFENSMLKRIFGPKRGETTGGWRQLHNEELRNSYF